MQQRPIQVDYEIINAVTKYTAALRILYLQYDIQKLWN